MECIQKAGVGSLEARLKDLLREVGVNQKKTESCMPVLFQREVVDCVQGGHQIKTQLVLRYDYE